VAAPSALTMTVTDPLLDLPQAAQLSGRATAAGGAPLAGVLLIAGALLALRVAPFLR
jgi:hypothetical protein